MLWLFINVTNEQLEDAGLLLFALLLFAVVLISFDVVVIVPVYFLALESYACYDSF